MHFDTGEVAAKKNKQKVTHGHETSAAAIVTTTVQKEEKISVENEKFHSLAGQ